LAADSGIVSFSIGKVPQCISFAPQTSRLWKKKRLRRPGDTLYLPPTAPRGWYAEDEAVEGIYVNPPPTF
jgi:hypothetical protein